MYHLGVAVQTPLHSGLNSRLGELLTYSSECALAPGSLVRVPLGKRDTLGIVWTCEAACEGASAAVDPAAIKPVGFVYDNTLPLSNHWRQLVRFTASYYQRSLGEVALSALPPALRELTPEQWQRRMRRKSATKRPQCPASGTLDQTPGSTAQAQALTPEQREVLACIEAPPTTDGPAQRPILLYGATGSGKTEVYLQAVALLLQREPQAQALVLVPEINLTPQLEARFAARFDPLLGPGRVVSLHSGLTPAQRLNNWLSAHRGAGDDERPGARIVLGTRLAVLASMPQLRLIVVDEEHDPSYKSQDGARLSARDLAIYRAQLEGTRVILGSATPSLESWYHSRPADQGGRYLRLTMAHRVGHHTDAALAQDADSEQNRSTALEGIQKLATDSGANTPSTRVGLPAVRLLDLTHQPRRTLIAPPLLAAMQERLARGEQIMLLHNRRGYAPVLHCDACNWKSDCPHCTAYRVFHKIDRTLRCHHCGYTQPVPRACPECGNLDIAPVGRGTEQIEEYLQHLATELRRPDGSAARVARIDADTTRLKGELQRQLAEVHAGDVDILVGTQMIAKGHDFRRITLVAAINPDSALFSSDYRAAERLFALLMQAAGRAGRSANLSAQAEMWVQTHNPNHPLYQALRAHDYPRFAASELQAREQAGMPPFSHQALVRAEARHIDTALGFLQAAAAVGADLFDAAGVTCYPAVPMTIQRVANIERAQMLLEATHRPGLQRTLAEWQAHLQALGAQPEHRGVIRWAVDVDPLGV